MQTLQPYVYATNLWEMPTSWEVISPAKSKGTYRTLEWSCMTACLVFMEGLKRSLSRRNT